LDCMVEGSEYTDSRDEEAIIGFEDAEIEEL